MSDHLQDDWQKLLERLPVDTTPNREHQDELRVRVLAAFDGGATPALSRRNVEKIGDFLMAYKAPYWSAAAILVACLAWLFYSGGTSALALDEVVANLAEARTARFDMTVKVIGQPEQKMKAFYLEPSRFRQEFENGYVNIADWTAGKMVGLDPDAMKATVFNIVNLAEDAKQENQRNQFEVIRETLATAVDDPESKVESLGEKAFDGRKLLGFRFRSTPQPMTVWADPRTRYPVRIEATMAGPPETQVVMDNFEFNIDLDESRFSVEIPEGYEVTETDVDASPASERDFLTSLQVGSEAMDGEFPSGFDPVAVARYVATYMQRQGIGRDGEPTSAQLQEVMRIARGFQFAVALPEESDAHYAGADVKRGEEDRPIFWYKPADADVYRVIYADLSVKEADTAPEIAEAKQLH